MSRARHRSRRCYIMPRSLGRCACVRALLQVTRRREGGTQSDELTRRGRGAANETPKRLAARGTNSQLPLAHLLFLLNVDSSSTSFFLPLFLAFPRLFFSILFSLFAKFQSSFSFFNPPYNLAVSRKMLRFFIRGFSMKLSYFNSFFFEVQQFHSIFLSVRCDAENKLIWLSKTNVVLVEFDWYGSNSLQCVKR